MTLLPKWQYANVLSITKSTKVAEFSFIEMVCEVMNKKMFMHISMAQLTDWKKIGNPKSSLNSSHALQTDKIIRIQ